MNLLALGISGDMPLRSLVSAMTSFETLAGALSQWSKPVCQNACPDVADLMSADKPKLSETGRKPVMDVNGPFCSDAVIFPRFLVIRLVTSPTH